MGCVFGCTRLGPVLRAQRHYRPPTTTRSADGCSHAQRTALGFHSCVALVAESLRPIVQMHSDREENTAYTNTVQDTTKVLEQLEKTIGRHSHHERAQGAGSISATIYGAQNDALAYSCNHELLLNSLVLELYQICKA
eukprot:1079830-Amphidinium_carterae.1